MALMACRMVWVCLCGMCVQKSWVRAAASCPCYNVVHARPCKACPPLEPAFVPLGCGVWVKCLCGCLSLCSKVLSMADVYGATCLTSSPELHACGETTALSGTWIQSCGGVGACGLPFMVGGPPLCAVLHVLCYVHAPQVLEFVRVLQCCLEAPALAGRVWLRDIERLICMLAY